MALFRSSSEQNIFSTVPQLHISAKGGKVFKSAGKQTIALTGQTIISSETGNIFHTDGAGSSQIVTGNFKELLANVGRYKPQQLRDFCYSAMAFQEVTEALSLIHMVNKF